MLQMPDWVFSPRSLFDYTVQLHIAYDGTRLLTVVDVQLQRTP